MVSLAETQSGSKGGSNPRRLRASTSTPVSGHPPRCNYSWVRGTAPDVTNNQLGKSHTTLSIRCVFNETRAYRMESHFSRQSGLSCGAQSPRLRALWLSTCCPQLADASLAGAAMSSMLVKLFSKWIDVMAKLPPSHAGMTRPDR